MSLDSLNGITPSALRLQLRVIAALVRRETRAHFGESRLGYLWAILEPSLHLLMYFLLFTYILVRGSPLGGSMGLFMLTGFVPFFLYGKVASYVASAITSNRALLNLPPVKPFDLVISRAIVQSVSYLIVAAILFTGLGFSGVAGAVPNRPLMLACAIIMIIVFGTGVGMLNAVIIVFFPTWSSLFSIISAPLYFVSGIWFLPEEVPQPYREYMLYNPLLHLVTWFRIGFYENYPLNNFFPTYALYWTVAVFIGGISVQRVAQRYILGPM